MQFRLSFPRLESGERSNVYWQSMLGEMIGTALLVFGGLTCVFAVMDVGAGDELPIPPWTKRGLAGFLFASVVTVTARSPLGRYGPAHYSPSVTFAALMNRKISLHLALWLIAAQIVGAVMGAFALRVWGEVCVTMHTGMTVPGPGVTSTGLVLIEAGVTWAVVLTAMLLQAGRLTGWPAWVAFPLLFAGLTILTGPLTGTSSNIARTLGPAIIEGRLQAVGYYALATAIGATLAAATPRFLKLAGGRPLSSRDDRVVSFLHRSKHKLK